MVIETWMTPTEFEAFLWHLQNDPPLPPTATPLFDQMEREPAKGIVHRWDERAPAVPRTERRDVKRRIR